MELGKALSVFTAIVSVAMVWVLVSNGNTAAIIKAWGDAFSGGLKAATGR